MQIGGEAARHPDGMYSGATDKQCGQPITEESFHDRTSPGTMYTNMNEKYCKINPGKVKRLVAHLVINIQLFVLCFQAKIKI